jgi:hypothetical protein
MADETLILGMKLGDFLISFGTLLTALFTSIVAIFTYKSAREINKTVLAQIVFKIREQFDSNEIKESIKILRNVEDEIGKGGISKALAANQLICQGNNKQSKKIFDYADEYYNIFYTLFKQIKILIDAKCLKNEVVSKIILPNEKYILFNIVEPLMRDTPEYDLLLFNEYRKILSDS